MVLRSWPLATEVLVLATCLLAVPPAELLGMQSAGGVCTQPGHAVRELGCMSGFVSLLR